MDTNPTVTTTPTVPATPAPAPIAPLIPVATTTPTTPIGGVADARNPLGLTPKGETVTPVKVDMFDFKKHLSEEFKDHKALKDYKDINGLVKSHLEQQKLIGKSDIPGENATEFEWNKFYKKLGRPEAPEEYQFAELPSLEGFNIDEQGVADFKKMAHDLGLTPKQADTLRTSFVQKAMEAHKQNYRNADQLDQDFELKGRKAFGNNYDKVIEQTGKILSENLNSEEKARLDNLDNDALLTLSSLVNRMTGKYSTEDSVNNNYSSGKTGADLKNELIAADDKLQKMNRFDPNYDSQLKLVKGFYAKGIKRF